MTDLRFAQRILLSACIALAAGACATDPGTGAGEQITDTDRGRPDAGDPDGGGGADTDTPPTGEERLEYVSEPDQRLRYTDAIDLQVRYVDANDNPVEGATITWSYDTTLAGDTRLTAATSRTDAEGIGTIGVRAGNARADFAVTVGVRGNDVITPIVFNIVVAPKDAADYIIRVNYDGPLRLQYVDVSLFTGTPRACSELERDPDNPSPDVAWFVENIRPTASGDFEDRTIEMRQDEIPIFYAVAFAHKEDQPVGYACNDALPVEVELGSATVIEINLEHLYPSVAGRYEATNTFDLLGALPDNVEQIVRYVGDFLTNPGQAVVDILVEQGIFDDLPSWVLAALPDVINGLIEAFAPEEVQVIFEVGGDVYTIATQFTLSGDIVIGGEPDASGRLPDCNTFSLTGITFTFQGIDYYRNLQDYGYTAAEGEWTGSIEITEEGVGYGLNIESFGFNINYGQIVLFALETIVFPQILGPEIDSLEAFVVTIIDCHQIAVDVGWSGVEPLCDTALDFVAGWLRDWLVTQAGSTDSVFQIHTPADQPCPLHDLDRPGDFVIDQMGREEIEQQCIWEGEFRWDTSSPTGEAVAGTFWGTKFSSSTVTCTP